MGNTTKPIRTDHTEPRFAVRVSRPITHPDTKLAPERKLRSSCQVFVSDEYRTTPRTPFRMGWDHYTILLY